MYHRYSDIEVGMLWYLPVEATYVDTSVLLISPVAKPTEVPRITYLHKYWSWLPRSSELVNFFGVGRRLSQHYQPCRHRNTCTTKWMQSSVTEITKVE
jgi:hypothetical protein